VNKLKPNTAYKVGDIVHLSTRVEKHFQNKTKTVLTFGKIERILADEECLVTHIEKLSGNWTKTVPDVPYKLSELNEYPNKQLIKAIKQDLLSESNADILGRWLGQKV
jgi:hypothetical protein